MGIPAASIVLLGWIIVVAILVQGVRLRPYDRIFPAGALAVAILAGTHSMVDFPLQIPGYAIVAFAIIGVGLAQSLDVPRRPAVSGQARSRKP